MATVYLNAATGNDANTYAQAQNSATPWLTLGKVNTSATTGDTVVMAAGTYTFASVNFAKYFVWVGAALANGHPTTILDGAAGNVQWALSDNPTFTNLTFQNIVSTSNTSPPIGYTNAAGTAGTATFNNCEFKNIRYYAANDWNSGTGLLGTFYKSGCAFVLNSCLIDDPLCTATKFCSAIFTGQASAAMGPSVTLTNCTIALRSADDYADALVSKCNVVTVKNCIFYNGTGSTVNFAGTASTSNAVSYCDNYLITGVPAGTGNITTDPLFVDPANANFRLRPTSPALDTGTLL